MKKTMLLLLLLPSIALADVYKCHVNGKTVYASSPCGADSTYIDPGQVLTDGISADVGRRNIEAARRYRQQIDADYAARMAIPSPPPPKVIDCSSQQRELDSVRASMHAGYPASMLNYWVLRNRQAETALSDCTSQ